MIISTCHAEFAVSDYNTNMGWVDLKD